MVIRGNAARFLASLLVFAAGLYAVPKAAAAFKNIQGGMEAPVFRLTDTAGNDVSLEAYKKEKAVILVFWATWSDRSVSELKDVQSLFSEYGAKGLKAVAVNVDHEHMTDGDVKAVREKVAELGLSFPVVFDAGLSTFRNYGVVAVPSTAILGGGGLIRNAFNGYPSFARLEMKKDVEVLLGLRKKEEAAAVARVEKGHKPVRQALLNYNLARRLYASGMVEMAEPKLAKAIAADSEWAAPRMLMGRILLGRAKKDPGKLDEAVKAFEAAAAAEKGNVVARTALARVYWRKGSAAEAEKEVNEALAISSSYTPAMLLKAAILAKKGNLPEAEKLMTEALALNPLDPESRALAGQAYEEAGELKKAARMYRKAWELLGE
jgi:tetratricopeptide (TPR) repeat protein